MYEFPLGGEINGYIGGSMTYSSSSYADLNESADAYLPTRALFDARIGINSKNGWNAGLWLRNLTDKYYWTTVFYSGDTLIEYAGQPRTFGATLGMKF